MLRSPLSSCQHMGSGSTVQRDLGMGSLCDSGEYPLRGDLPVEHV